MARLSLILSIFVAITAFPAYRVRYLIQNALLPPRSLPDEYYRGPGACEVIRAPGVSSCEDERFWTHGETGERRVLVACDPGRFEWNTVLGPMNNADPRGSLWVLDVDTLVPQKVAFENFPETHTFHPLGFELTPGLSGVPSRMYVVNHARDASVLEEFEVEWDNPTRARWVRTLSDPSLPGPNSVAIASDGSLYVSNDHRFPLRHGLVPNALETFLALPIGHISHISFSSPSATPNFSTVASGIPFANGVALSRHENILAVASTTGTSVRLYSRNATTNVLTFMEEILVPFASDNVSFDDNDELLVAGHPDFPALIAMSKRVPGARSPSWVVALRKTDTEPGEEWDAQARLPASRKVPKPSGGWAMETVYQSSGQKGFAASTTALRDVGTGHVFIIGLYEDGVLVCKK
ncbi:hypothetical protein K488DRAFT_82057 [Vararia minispora EC-137]|uniref:Uncharacterized protein n=1 Tax=Vararia minispora EC-137 TaxID=1314806 RepID=A0ACB8QXK6_9AGAM|nr:hypothetical protein K488DRAFT_82057 [Vararia minispora EC-137]